MLRRPDINAASSGRIARFLLGVADAVRWPFERFAWLLERYLIWPLRERSAGRGPSGGVAGVAGLAALAAAAIAVGVLWPSGGDSSGQGVTALAARDTTATAAPTKAAKPEGPVLHGASPSFGIGAGIGVSSKAGSEAGDAEGGAPTTPEASAPAAQAEDSPAAKSSSAQPVPPGPAAMKVARHFSEAFVFYEVGKRPAQAKAIFAETATPQLASALDERPPRLPQDAKVPRARVVNLVPGPRAGKAYTVSVSLLRVGLTSELRLELNKKNGNWLVTDVRG